MTIDSTASGGLRTANFRTSSYSSGTGNCVAIGHGHSRIGVQDTKQGPDSQARTTLSFPTSAFATFVTRVTADDSPL
ncbi:MAG: DUF397 domain-containing protein [Umezawaea sp.]